MVSLFTATISFVVFFIKVLHAQITFTNPISSQTSCISENMGDGYRLNCTGLGFVTADPMSLTQATTMYVTILSSDSIAAVGLGERVGGADAWCTTSDFPVIGKTWASKSVTRLSNCCYNMIAMYTSSASTYSAVKPYQAAAVGNTYKWTFTPGTKSYTCWQVDISMPYPDGTFTGYTDSPGFVCSSSKSYYYASNIILAPYFELEGAGTTSFYVQSSLCTAVSDCISCPDSTTCQFCRPGYQKTNCGTCTNSNNLICPVVVVPDESDTDDDNNEEDNNGTPGEEDDSEEGDDNDENDDTEDDGDTGGDNEEDDENPTDPDDTEEDDENPTDPDDNEEDNQNPTDPDDNEEDIQNPTDPDDTEEDDENPTDPDDTEEDDGNPTDPDDNEEDNQNPTDPDDNEEDNQNPSDPDDNEEDNQNPTDPDGNEEDNQNPSDPDDNEEDNQNPSDPDDENSTDPDDNEEDDENSTNPDESDETDDSNNEENAEEDDGNGSDPDDDKTDPDKNTETGKTITVVESGTGEDYATRIIALVAAVIAGTVGCLALLFCKQIIRSISARRNDSITKKSVKKIHPAPSQTELNPSLDLDTAKKSTPRNNTTAVTSSSLTHLNENESLFDFSKKSNISRSRNRVFTKRPLTTIVDEVQEDLSVVVLANN